MAKYIKAIGSGILLLFAFLFIILACSKGFQNQLTIFGKFYICIVSISNFMLTARYFVDKACELNK